MNTYIIKQGNRTFEVLAENLTIDCRSFQYTSTFGKQVVVIDEPLSSVTFTGKREA